MRPTPLIRLKHRPIVSNIREGAFFLLLCVLSFGLFGTANTWGLPSTKSHTSSRVHVLRHANTPRKVARKRRKRRGKLPSKPININTANARELRRLPRVGKRTAERIIALRQQLGGFKSIEQLTKVKGIGKGTLRKIRPYVTLSGGAPSARPPVVRRDAPEPPPVRRERRKRPRPRVRTKRSPSNDLYAPYVPGKGASEPTVSNEDHVDPDGSGYGRGKRRKRRGRKRGRRKKRKKRRKKRKKRKRRRKRARRERKKKRGKRTRRRRKRRRVAMGQLGSSEEKRRPRRRKKVRGNCYERWQKKDGDPTLKVNVNIATVSELKALPCIGKKRALAIVSFRQTQGPYFNVGDLKRVTGLGPKIISLLTPHLQCKINLNTVTAQQLTQMKPFSKRVARSIVRLRKRKRGFSAVKQILHYRRINRKVYKEIKDLFFVSAHRRPLRKSNRRRRRKSRKNRMRQPPPRVRTSVIKID